MEESRRHVGNGGLVIGLMLIAVGVILMLARTGLIEWSGRSFWPLIIITFGLAKLLKPRRNGRREGGWLFVIGVWLLLNEMHILRYGDSWPLLLVAAGVSMVWTAGTPRPRSGSEI